MPCDTIQLNELEIGKMHPKLLIEALRQIGATTIRVETNGSAQFALEGQWCRIDAGRLIVAAGSEHLADRIKVGYSRQATIYTARKNGWKLKEVRPNVFQVIK